VEKSLRMGRVGPYQLQAAIAAVHAQAKTAEETDWKQIAALYAVLARTTVSPVIALNHAVAVAMSRGFETGLELIEQIAAAPGDLDSYYLYHAARADLLRRLRRNEEALAAYQRALSFSANAVERRYLRRRMAELRNV
jgi:RNA polymerase sigma-70 factor, ECF subfamily